MYVRYNEDGSLKSSVDKFYTPEDLKNWAEICQAKPGDLLLLLCGPKNKTLPQLSELRLEMGERLGLRDKNVFKPLWVVDFPLLEWDEETQRFYAMHHPFTSPHPEDVDMMESNPGAVRANAYDMVINGVEVGGGSIRIHNTELQSRMFKCLDSRRNKLKNNSDFCSTHSNTVHRPTEVSLSASTGWYRFLPVWTVSGIPSHSRKTIQAGMS